jgi:hypothetical protein
MSLAEILTLTNLSENLLGDTPRWEEGSELVFDLHPDPWVFWAKNGCGVAYHPQL